MNLKRLPGRAWQTKCLRYVYAGETYEQQKMGALDMFQVVLLLTFRKRLQIIR